jgi:hypothetical protein
LAGRQGVGKSSGENPCKAFPTGQYRTLRKIAGSNFGRKVHIHVKNEATIGALANRCIYRICDHGIEAPLAKE